MESTGNYVPQITSENLVWYNSYCAHILLTWAICICKLGTEYFGYSIITSKANRLYLKNDYLAKAAKLNKNK